MPNPDSRPQRFVLAHGFTQTAQSWAKFEELLREEIPDADPVPIDLPGHGNATTAVGDLWSSADYLVEYGQQAVYVGYSLGGRVSLHAALAHPEQVDALVLIGATAGLDSAEDRRARRESDEQLATRLEAIGLETFVDEWLTNPLFDGLTDQTDQREDRLRNSATALAASLRSNGTGTQEPLWDRLGEVEVPVLVLVGEQDHRFRALGERLAEALPHATYKVISEAGHSVHLEQPTYTADAIADWYRFIPQLQAR